MSETYICKQHEILNFKLSNGDWIKFENHQVVVTDEQAKVFDKDLANSKSTIQINKVDAEAREREFLEFMEQQKAALGKGGVVKGGATSASPFGLDALIDQQNREDLSLNDKALLGLNSQGENLVPDVVDSGIVQTPKLNTVPKAEAKAETESKPAKKQAANGN